MEAEMREFLEHLGRKQVNLRKIWCLWIFANVVQVLYALAPMRIAFDAFASNQTNACPRLLREAVLAAARYR